MAKRRNLILFLAGVCAAFANAACGADTPVPPPAETVVSTNAPLPEVPTPNEPRSWYDLSRWSFQVGVGFITESTVDDILTGSAQLPDEEGGGEIYLFQVSYKLASIDQVIWKVPSRFDIELPLVFGLVDEDGASAFEQYSGGVTVRWKNFPWNRWVYTNIETGVGLTYSHRVLATERVRHPGRDRSHLEFYWPVQIMLAHPRYRQHQLVLFNHHHSGGGIFHTGGANTLGVGYRFVFDE